MSRTALTKTRGTRDPAGPSLELTTTSGKYRYLPEVITSHLSYAVAEELAQRLGHARSKTKALVLAPHVGRPMGALLAERGINYLDRAGNCHLELGRTLVHIEGKTEPKRASTSKALRAPSYQVLFALLADPALAKASVRALAEAAGVSRQPAWDILRRLDEEGTLVAMKAGRKWLPGGQRDAFHRWLVGYETSVRPHLLVHELQTADQTPDELEERVAPILDRHAKGWRYGGTAAGYRLTKHYRGPRTVVHLPAGVSIDPKALRALPRPSGGNLTLLRSIGTVGMKGITADTVHPLLAYTEMLIGRDERAREAAHEIATRYLGDLV